MSLQTSADLTDDSYDEEISDAIEESIEESSYSNSREDSDCNVTESTNTVKRSYNEDSRRISCKNKEDIVTSDSDSSTDLCIRPSYTREENSFSKQVSRNISSSIINDTIDRSQASFVKIRTPQRNSYSGSDDDIGVKLKTKKNVIYSDSESDSENLPILNKSTVDRQSSASNRPNDSEEEVGKDEEFFASSRISSEFNFGSKGNIINSTVLDIENQNTPKAGSKRLLNRSIETPRILKQQKDSSTPANVALSNYDPMRTPRNIKAIIPSRSPSPSNSIEVVTDSDSDIIDISSGDASPPLPTPVLQRTKKAVKQTTLDSLVIRKNVNEAEAIKGDTFFDVTQVSGKELAEQKELLDAFAKRTTSYEANQQKQNSEVIEVSPKELAQQKELIRKLEVDLHKALNLLRTVNADSLPDKGKLLREKHSRTEELLAKAVRKMKNMVVSKEDPPEPQPREKKSWEDIEAAVGSVMPKTFGRQALNTYNAQKALTVESLKELHGSLKACPSEDTLEEDPKGLKVELMQHQRRALAWLKWRENQKPSGGILADDMGLGKTLTMISFMLRMREIEPIEHEDENEKSEKYRGGTLVVCPASLINQWSGELERRTKRGLASCELYHGPKRETKAKRLAEYDMVITTYAIVNNECERRGAVFRVKWRRIILDEAHQVRNHKSQTSDAVCKLSAKSRWALTGTPVHNKELDMYALLKFLRCTPFDDLQVWKRWVGDKSTGGQERLHTVISSLMLRRTKAELMEKGILNCMPERKWELVPVTLNKNEMDVYQKILLFSRTLFAQFLHQRAEKNQDIVDYRVNNFNTQPNGPNQEYFKMREKLLRFHKVKDIKQHEILVLLLRLRQICCHPSLITNMLHEDIDNLDDENGYEDINILDQLNKLALDDDKYDDANMSDVAQGLANREDAPGFKEAAKSLLNPSNPIFSKERLSSKIGAVLKVVREKVVNTSDKGIIVSQWPSFLDLIAYHLKQERIPFDKLDGKVPVPKRMMMVDDFNNPKNNMKVLLLSLTAGGVGLNLIGGNHLFLLDLHWNPQLENQAQDRIYRVGQQKPVFIYKFMATDTIEKRILDLQEQKLEIANAMLTGTQQLLGSKLSLQDLKLLFDM